MPHRLPRPCMQIAGHASSYDEGDAPSGGIWGRAGRALLSSLLQQSQRLLPWWAAAYGATAMFALVQVAASRRPEGLAVLLGAKGSASGVAFLAHLTQFLQDAAEEIVILLGAFTLLDFKRRAVAFCQALVQRNDRCGTMSDAVGLVAALGTMASGVSAPRRATGNRPPAACCARASSCLWRVHQVPQAAVHCDGWLPAAHLGGGGHGHAGQCELLAAAWAQGACALCGPNAHPGASEATLPKQSPLPAVWRQPPPPPRIAGRLVARHRHCHAKPAAQCRRWGDPGAAPEPCLPADAGSTPASLSSLHSRAVPCPELRMSHASGCVQYAMRPFSLGDRIILRHVSGMVVLEGVVAALHPTRTVIVGEPELAVDASSGSSDSDSGEHKLTSFINNGEACCCRVGSKRAPCLW